MVQKILICYKFKNMKLKDRSKFKRKLYGSIEKTHGGKYITKIQGILSNKDYEKPVRSVIIIDKKDQNEVIKLLKEFNAEIKIFTIKEKS
jgi:hypothetical protein